MGALAVLVSVVRFNDYSDCTFYRCQIFIQS